jgi:predicted HAD superfamily Cof-like phosphohydrolase
MPSKLRQQVYEFMTAFRHPILDKPTTPPLPRFKLRARLIAEEAIETIEAMCGNRPLGFNQNLIGPCPLLFDAIAQHHPKNKSVTYFSAARALLDAAIADTKPRTLTLKEMTEVADGMADLDYVTEGARLEFGINGERIANLVHVANMAKRGATERDDGKTLKPEGWKPPNEAIGEELIRQGFELGEVGDVLHEIINVDSLPATVRTVPRHAGRDSEDVECSTCDARIDEHCDIEWDTISHRSSQGDFGEPKP